MQKNRIYEDSIILIGASGEGKTEVTKELAKKLNLPFSHLDTMEQLYRTSGFYRAFSSREERSLDIIQSEVKKIEKYEAPTILDFGAVHSVYQNKEIFGQVKQILEPFQNRILLMYSPDIQETLEVIDNRSRGLIINNRIYLTNPCNRELATITIYTKEKSISEVADCIIQKIQERKQQKQAEMII